MSGGQSFTPGIDRSEPAASVARAQAEPLRAPEITTAALEPAPQEQDVPLTDASYVPFHAPIITHTPEVTDILLASYSEPETMSDATIVRDIRQVTGDRVNIREGAGTQHSVISKAVRGDEAEVLLIDGDWAQIQLIESGETGWMAAWLLSE
ncbi:hypothetical protein TW80_17150 [Loktanella sp. S4079]|nr:hypothetical protein TW80_17150 [Loktanella sp. S4079]